MRFRIRKKAPSSSSDNSKAAASSLAADAAGAAAADTNTEGGGGVLIAASPDYNSSVNGSKDESFFESRPWLDSDSEDDFQSVRGDFSRGSTPDHQGRTPARISLDRLNPSSMEKKQRLLELLQEKQPYDEEHDSPTDAGSEAGMNSIVHAEEHLNPSSKGDKAAKKSSKTGCFPCSVWKLSFTSCWKKKKEHKD